MEFFKRPKYARKKEETFVNPFTVGDGKPADEETRVRHKSKPDIVVREVISSTLNTTILATSVITGDIRWILSKTPNAVKAAKKHRDNANRYEQFVELAYGRR